MATTLVKTEEPKNGGTPPRKPLKTSPVLTKDTQTVVNELQKELGIPFLAYWTSAGGQICQNDVMGMAHLLENQANHKTIGLFLKSDGGNPEAALRLVHLLRQHYEDIKLFAPFACASAATMVALGANEIHMGPTSFLTAVDTSLKHELSPVDHNNYLVSVSQDEVQRILRMWRDEKNAANPFPEIYKYLHPLVLGALDRSSSLSIRVCKELLGYHMKDKKRAHRISMELNSTYPSHSYPITLHEAQRLGLQVKPMNKKVLELLRKLNGIYSAMCQVLVTDYDEQNYHNNEICNILERHGKQVYFQIDKDWHYRKEERRWDPMNDQSGWHRVEIKRGKVVNERLYIR